MRTVLAALDSSISARPVLDTALGIADLMGASVDAVHVVDGATETPRHLTDRHGVALQLLDGPVEPALLAAISSPEVVAAVLGARSSPSDPRPAGHTALSVLEHAGKPIVAVPPAALDGTSRAIHRILLPLEGREESSRPVLEQLLPLLVAEIELVVLHVFTDATAPRFLDRPQRDLELLSEEFLRRHCPTATRIELRSGGIGRWIGDVRRDQTADLIVLSWSQTMGAGHAAVIRDVLVHADAPVLLIPVAPPESSASAAPDR